MLVKSKSLYDLAAGIRANIGLFLGSCGKGLLYSMCRILSVFLTSVILFFAQIGCVQAPTQSSDATPFFTHPVRFEGETLSSIAQWYLKSPNEWKILQDLNPALNPLKLQVGDRIKIPLQLAKRQTLPTKQEIVGSISIRGVDRVEAPNRLESAPTGESDSTGAPQALEPLQEVATALPTINATEATPTDEEKLFKDFKPSELEKRSQ